MRLLALGHSAYLIEMLPAGGGAPVRVLADPWLSDHLIGDLLGRFPRVRLDWRRLTPVHAIFLSHSHTDHCDPYSLVALWRTLSPKPALILPQSMAYLAGLFREFLGGVEIRLLAEGAPIDLHGLSIEGRFNPEIEASNEDDVMVLIAKNDTEVFIGESDALLPFYHPEGRAVFAGWCRGGDEADEPDEAIETIACLSIRNQGEATMAMLASRGHEDRQERLERCLESVYEEVGDMYIPIEDLEDDPWQDSRLVRLIGGQGIGFPQALGRDWNRVLFPIRIADRVRIEGEIAGDSECRHQVEELVPGAWHVLERGRLAEREPEDAVELLDREEDRDFDPGIDLYEDFPAAPLRGEARDHERQRRMILECLEHRFLPHLIGARNPPVEHLLAAGGGRYRIRVRFGNAERSSDRDYVIGFERLRFEESDPEGEADERYWANDLEDVLEGRADEFSTFCRHPLGGSSQRLWRALGLPYLNNDLIEKKLRYHFERAARGEPLADWVLGFYR
jgi:hypothetical protein